MRSYPLPVIRYWLLLVLLLMPVAAQAQIIPDCPAAKEATGIVPCSGLDCTVGCFFELLVRIYNWLLGIAAFVALLILIGSGIYMFIYHYLEQPEQHLSSAKLTFTRALTGLVVVASAYLIVNTLLILLGANTATALRSLLFQLGFLL